MAEGFKVMEIPADHPYHIVTGIGAVIPVIQETVDQPFIFCPEQIFDPCFGMLRWIVPVR